MFYEGDIDVINIQNLIKNKDMYQYDGSRFFTPKEGFLRGNMFKGEYQPYKNLTYLEINPTNELEALLLKVYEYDFAVNDLGLHLDIYPDDVEAYELFRMCAREYEKSKKEYEMQYGPLSLEDTTSRVYNWNKDPWPWEEDRGSVYV